MQPLFIKIFEVEISGHIRDPRAAILFAQI